MSTRYTRTICYSEGRNSEFTEEADCLSEALDRELKFVANQTGFTNAKRKKIISITIRKNDSV